MESPSLPESLPVSSRIQAIQELTRGRELVNILSETLWWPKSLEFYCASEDDVVVHIQSMLENALAIMSSCSSSESQLVMANDLPSSRLNEPKAKYSNQSLSRKVPVKTRRKNSWTSAQVSSVLLDDGHVWRKYGQKHIINENYHRSYYRCTYKFDQRCLATKQVQMIQENPPKYRTTYNGQHTCKNLLRAPQIILDTSHDDIKDSSILLSFETNRVVEKKHVDHNFGAIKQEFKEMVPAANNFKDNSLSSAGYNYISGDHPHVCVSEQPLELISMTSMSNVANLHVELGDQWIQQLQTDCYYQTF